MVQTNGSQNSQIRQDRSVHRKRFRAESQRIFSQDVESIECLAIFPSTQGLRRCTVSERGGIPDLIQVSASKRVQLPHRSPNAVIEPSHGLTKK